MALILTGSSGSTTLDSSAGLTFSDSSNQQYAAGPYVLKNRLINGAFQIAQRATSATITAGSTIALGYSTVDRWYAYCTGANVTAAQVAGSGNNKNLFQITGAASVTAVGIGQRIEQLNSYDLAGQTVTLSASIANSLLTSVTWTAYYANTADTFGTLASPTRTQIATGTFTVTSTLTQYSTQISIPAAATTGIEIVFTVGAQTSGTWQLGNVQLEIGSTVTPFERRLYNQELANCQRYYQFIGSFMGAAWNTTDLSVNTVFPTAMRATPTIAPTASLRVTLSGVGNYDQSSASASINTGNTSGVYFNCGNFSGLTAYRPYSLVASGFGIVSCSAEL